MTERDRQRLAALLARFLPQLPPHERAEACRLLGPPGPDLFPSAPPCSAPPVAREECPAGWRTAEAAPLHGADDYPLSHHAIDYHRY